MRSIRARFEMFGGNNSSVGAYINLANAVKHQKFSRKNLVKNFKKLMPEDEYAKDETKQLVDYLEVLTNMPEEVEKRDKIVSLRTLYIKNE